MATKTKRRKSPAGAGGDVITVHSQGKGNAVAAGRGAKASVTQAAQTGEIGAWRKDMERRIEASKDLLPADKTDLKESVAKVAEEVAKGKQADAGRLERLLNVIGGMAPDIFDVALATLGNPLAGLGLVAKKIGERAKLEAHP